MPSTVFGLPTHVLLIHAVVVLLPIAALLTVLTVVWPTFRHRYGLAVLIFAFVTSLTVPLAAQAGESLLARLPETQARMNHAALGQQLEIWTAIFGLVLFGVLAVDLYRRAPLPDDRLTASERWVLGFAPATWRERQRSGATAVFRALQVAALVLAVGVLVVTFRAGDSGARAVWSHYPQLASSASAGG